MQLTAGDLRIEWHTTADGAAERIAVRREDQWIELARSDPARSGVQSLVFQARVEGVMRDIPVAPDRWSADPEQVHLWAHVGDTAIEAIWRVVDDHIRAEVRIRIAEQIDLESVRSSYLYAPAGRPYQAIKPLDLVYTPNLRPLAHDVIGDHRFHAPAVVLQKDSLGFAFLPDIDPLKSMRIRRIKTALNYDVLAGEFPLIEYGFLDWQGRDHVYYEHRPGATIALSNQELVYGFVLMGSAQAEPASYHRPVARYYYERHLAPTLRAQPEQQLQSFDQWERHTWYEYGPKHWWQAEVAGQAIGDFSSHREFVPGRLWNPTLPDGWFNHWFQSLRTALGLFRSGHRLNDLALIDQAKRVLNLCLLAPQREGAFPVVVYWDAAKSRLYWEKDNTWAGIPNWYHSFDMCWTGYWLLAWHEELHGEDLRMLPRCRALGDFLLRGQLPSGCIPSFYDGDLTPNLRYLYDDNAETAGCAVFLFRLHAVTGERGYLDGAVRAMTYIRDQVVPANRWFDFETFFSCAPKPIDFTCTHTDQLPQNNLSIIQACLGFLLWRQATGDTEALAAGERLVDYLSLFQQVWSPPWLTPNLLGGFGTQNTDAEWSDARQCYAADLYFAYYEQTGSREYFERGVAAMRSTFPVAPYENWAHRLEDVHGSWTGIHWGTGSALASVLAARKQYGDAFVDARAGWGAGLDGCTVEFVGPSADRLAVTIRFAFASAEPVRMVVRSDHPLHVVVNDHELGYFAPDALAAGISAPRQEQKG
jgi:hypothetical protein